MTSKPIRRLGSLRAVWLTYWTRPLVWIFMVVLLLFIPGAWQMWVPKSMPGPVAGQAPSRIFESAIPRTPQPNPGAQVIIRENGNVEGTEPQWSKLRSLTIYGGVAHCLPLWTPDAMPRLESLTLFEPIQDHQILKLCELYDLKSLAVTCASDLTSISLDGLALEPRLQFLSLNIYSTPTFEISPPGMTPEDLQQRAEKKARILQNAKSLTWPASLRTLIFEDVRGTGMARLQEWQQLPNLKRLAIRLNPIEGSRLPEEMLSSLKSFPQLRNLYLHEYAAASELAAVQQRLLPALQVRPAQYDSTAGRRASVVMTLGMIVVTLLVIQLSTQFVNHASQFLPGFAAPHVKIVVLGLGLTWFFSLVALIVAGCSLIAAVGLASTPMLLICGSATLFRRVLPIPLPGFANFGMVMPTVIFPSLGLQVLTGLYGAEFDWFIRGHHPWLAIGLLIAAGCGVVDLLKWLAFLPRQLEEAGCANVPLGLFDTAGWTEWGRTLGAIREAKGKKTPFVIRSRDAELDRFIESFHERGQTTLLTLWRQGNPQSVFRFLLIFAMLIVPILAVIAIAVSLLTDQPLDFSWPQNGWQMLWPVAFQLSVMLLILPFVVWWQRRPMMSMELLRPVDRREWHRAWFQGVAVEMIPVLSLAIAVPVIAWSTGGLAVATFALTVAGAAGTVALLAALGLCLLTTTSIRWIFVALAVGAIITVIVIIVQLLLTVVGNETQFVSSTAIQFSLVALLNVAAYVAFRFAWWRWQRFEVGRIQ